MAVEEGPSPLEEPCLWVVGTPIGNLEDMTLRGIRTLGEAWAVAAEDTRHARKLFTRFDLPRPQRWISYREENREQAGDEVLRVLGEGHSVALVTDAGTPGISDPGSLLVARCHAAGFRVSPIPGPSALVSAVACSGLASERLAFEGFLSRRTSHRRRLLATLAREPRTMVFYEAPSRVVATLGEFVETFGAARAACVARELTKKFEEIRTAPLGDLLRWAEAATPRGEFTIVAEGLGGTPAERERDEPVDSTVVAPDARALMAAARSRGLSRRQAAREVSQRLGLPSADLYRLSLEPDPPAAE